MKDAGIPGGAGAADSVTPHSRTAQAAPTPTLHQLRVFRAVARADSLTRAAKDLGLTQPSLSLQLAKLEQTIGTRLFHRRPGAMELTEAGLFLLPHVEQVLRLLVEAETGLEQFRRGYRPVVRLAGIDSVLCSILPAAIAQMQPLYPDVSFDIRECAPAEIVDLLHARRINVGLVSANSLAQTHGDFLQVPILEDPYVLAVPNDLVLDELTDPEQQLSRRHWDLLNRTVHFVFGSAQADRVSAWYDRLLPGHRPVAQCRSFETALSLVRAGNGVCAAPALAMADRGDTGQTVRRYLIDTPPRRIVALLLPQQRRLEPIATLIAQLQAAGAACSSPRLLPTPPFMAGALRDGQKDTA